MTHTTDDTHNISTSFSWKTAAQRIRTVAGFELVEAFRSRKAVGLLLLYIAGSLLATGIFAKILNQFQEQILKKSPLGAIDLRAALRDNQDFLRMLTQLVGDHDIALALIEKPPLALFYGWVALTFVPLFVILVAHSTVSSEIATGSARFILFRCHRLEWAVGKLLSQFVLAMCGVFLGGIASFLLGWSLLSHFELIATLNAIVSLSVSATFFAFPYVCLALAISLVARTPNGSRNGAILGYFGLALLSSLVGAGSYIEQHAPFVSSVIGPLLPPTHRLLLWHPHLSQRFASIAFLVGIGVIYFAMGYLWFRRRDA